MLIGYMRVSTADQNLGLQRATLAEFESDLIHERTMAGLVAARARGRSGGRPRVMTRQKLKAAMALMADHSHNERGTGGGQVTRPPTLALHHLVLRYGSTEPMLPLPRRIR